jgi:hypothetical protein
MCGIGSEPDPRTANYGALAVYQRGTDGDGEEDYR